MNEDKIKPLVKQIQEILKADGAVLILDGLLGTKTHHAAVRYQQKHRAVPTKAPIARTPMPSAKGGGLIAKAPLAGAQKVVPIKPKAWRLALSLQVLREQLNITYPNRSKKSDGAIGDAAHMVRTSDHNPWVVDPDTKEPIVTAFDITHDPANGVDCGRIAQAIIDDPRLKYMIWQGRIYTPAKSKKWNVYNGTNKHTQHIHISVLSNRSDYDNKEVWDLS